VAFKPSKYFSSFPDVQMFYFFRYDGSDFTRTKDMYVPDEPHSEFLAGMRKGMFSPQLRVRI
jgi:hypothetical protein